MSMVPFMENFMPINGLTGQFSIEVAGKNMAGTCFSVNTASGFHIVFEK